MRKYAILLVVCVFCFCISDCDNKDKSLSDALSASSSTTSTADLALNQILIDQPYDWGISYGSFKQDILSYFGDALVDFNEDDSLIRMVHIPTGMDTAIGQISDVTFVFPKFGEEYLLANFYFLIPNQNETAVEAAIKKIYGPITKEEEYQETLAGGDYENSLSSKLLPDRAMLTNMSAEYQSAYQRIEQEFFAAEASDTQSYYGVEPNRVWVMYFKLSRDSSSGVTQVGMDATVLVAIKNMMNKGA